MHTEHDEGQVIDPVIQENGQTDEDDGSIPMEYDELAMLKQKADLMGIKYSNNIGIETLRARIVERLEGTATTESTTGAAPLLVRPDEPRPPKQTLRQYLQQENMKLIRVRITCMNPQKADMSGEILTVANEYIGTVRKFVSYGEFTDNGYHIPNCLYKMMKRRKFQSIKQVKIPGPLGSNNYRVERSWVPEYNIEVLPQLTRQELTELASKQHANRNID